MDKILEDLQIHGFSLIKGALTNFEVDELRDELERIWIVQKDEVAEYFDIEKTTENNIIRAPLAYSESFAKAYNNPTIIPLIKAVLGDYFILSQQNGVVVHPNIPHSQSRWHRDLSHMNFVSNPPLAINAFFCLSDFNKQSGATQLIPYSHRSNEAPSEEYIDRHGISIEAKSGDVFLFDTMLFHRTGVNTSDHKRIGLNHIYTKYILKQQIDIPALLNYKKPDDAFLNMLLGFDSLVPTSVSEYRNIRKINNDKKMPV